MIDLLDLITNKETIVRKRVTNFIEKMFNFMDFDFKHDTFKSIVYGEEAYVSNLEEKFKRVYDSFLYLILNRKNQLSTYVLNAFFQIYFGYTIEEAKVLRLCNTFYFFYDENPIDKAILFSFHIYNEFEEFAYPDKVFLSLIFFNYCLFTREIPCIQFLTSDIKKFVDLLEEYKQEKDMQHLYLFILEVFDKQKFQDKAYYANIEELNVKEIFSKIYVDKEFLKLKFKIKNIFLFGSFSKGKQRKDSDLDFLVFFDLDLLVDEKESLKKELERYLYEIFHRFIDIHEVSNYLTEENLIRNKKIKKIF